MKLAGATFLADRPFSVPIERRELLPFRVRLTTGPQDLRKAVEIRSAAYTRHIPRLGNALRAVEAEDERPDVLLLIAERKLDRRAVGTIRLEPNLLGPLRIEGETKFPEIYNGKRLVETTRLGVENGSTGSMVMYALIKAAFAICHATGIDYGISVGRRPMVEIFRSMCYDVLAGPIPISYAYNVLLSVCSIPIQEVDARLQAKGGALFDFMARVDHPDITVDYDQVFAAFGRPGTG